MPVLSCFCTCVKISMGPVLLCTRPKLLPFKGKRSGLVYRSTELIGILTRVQYLYICQNLNGSSAHPSRTLSKGNELGPVHRSTGPVEILTRLCTGPVEILTRVQFLYMCQNLNGPVLLCTGPKPLPFTLLLQFLIL